MSAFSAIDLNIKLATSAAPIWSGQVFQKIVAKRTRLNITAQMNNSRSGCSSQFSVSHIESVQKIQQSRETMLTSLCLRLHTKMFRAITNGSLKSHTELLRWRHLAKSIWHLFVCLSVPSAYSPWPTRGQHATRPAYIFGPIIKRTDILVFTVVLRDIHCLKSTLDFWS